jgi:hypothetical protein
VPAYLFNLQISTNINKMILDGILFHIFFRFNIMVLKLCLPQPYHGYVKTFQWWLIAAQRCATEGYLVFPPPPPPEPDSRRVLLYKTLMFFYIWPILLSLVDWSYTLGPWGGEFTTCSATFNHGHSI